MDRKYTACLATLILAAPLAHAQGYSELDINALRVRMYSNGLIGPDLGAGTSAFTVPGQGGAPLLYSSGLWLGGLSSDGQLKLAAHLYGANGQRDFFPGPLTTDGNASITPQVSALYDQVWRIEQADVDLHRAYYACASDPACDLSAAFPNGYTVPTSFINWPAIGDVAAGQALYLAPFFDYNADGNYNPFDGDHPCVLGDQALYSIFNDKLNAHTQSGGQPIGVEVHMMPFAYASDPALANTVFVLYKIINRSTQTLTDFRIGHFADLELGCGQDDHVGTDAERALIYAVNGDALDEPCLGAPGFGSQPPAFGMAVLKGHLLEPDGVDNATTLIELYQYGTGYADAIIDNERYGLSGSMYWPGQGAAGTTDPSLPNQYFNYLRGYWANSVPLTYGGTGYSLDPNAVPTDYAFPGASDAAGLGTDGVPQAPWTETSAGNTAGDRRALAWMGPGTLDPGEHINLLLAYVYAPTPTGSVATSLEALVQRVDSVRAFASDMPNMWTSFEEHWPLTCGELPTGQSEPGNMVGQLTLFPNPATHTVQLNAPNMPSGALLDVYDCQGALVSNFITTGPNTTLDVSALPEGLYLVRMVASNGLVVGRFIKE